MFDIIELMISFLLGIIAGITEFLPISSTGHILLIQYFLNCKNDHINLFVIVTQIGPSLAILKVFWYRLYSISSNCMLKLFVKNHYHSHLCILHILIGTLPGLIVGMFFCEKIKLLFEPIYIVYGLVSGGMFLLIGEYWLKFRSLSTCISQVNNITYTQAFWIGCFQCLAFCPGFSRSGATIGGGLLVGLNRQVSLEFSFFLAIPIILGSVLFTVYYHIADMINIFTIVILIIGCVTAFVSSILVVKTFLKIVQQVSLIPFVIYRFLLAGVIFFNQ